MPSAVASAAKSFFCIAPPVLFFIHPWRGQSGSGFLPHVAPAGPPSVLLACALELADALAAGATEASTASAIATALAVSLAFGVGCAVEAGVVAVVAVPASSAVACVLSFGHAASPAAMRGMAMLRIDVEMRMARSLS